jgi:hypothetical protein
MSGDFDGKMIVLAALMDEAAYPWQSDWYRSRVKSAQGSRFDDRYRLYFIDNAMHTTPNISPRESRPVTATRVISYQGALQQALRDLSAWVEKGTPPPASTSYEVVDGQVHVARTAAQRRGLQPVVSALANGGQRAEVKVGEAVEFTGSVDAAPGAGVIVKAEWDFEGVGDYAVVEQFTPETRVAVKTTHTFTEPGTYFPALRVASQRDGASSTPYAQVLNLCRVRVVVT